MQAIDLQFPRPHPAICRILVGAGALARLADDLGPAFPGRPLFVVSDDNVAPLHARPLVERLARCGLPAELLTFPAGEPSKTRQTKQALEDRLFEAKAGRDAVLVAVGGGVTGDLAGYLAATWQRGVPVVQVPTSLLAMVDASLGGKTAVNLPGGKNLVGAFHQPWGVYADVSVLSTLPEPFYREGFAEVFKAAAIADAGLLDTLEQTREQLSAREEQALEAIVARAVEIKCGIVQHDEREAGRRMVLNFGHTVGHALETVTGYTLSHGAAVAIGICVEARLAVELTGFPEPHARRLETALADFGLPTRLPPELDAEDVIRAAKHDKKARSGRMLCALPLRLGRMPSGDDLGTEVDDRLLLSALGLN